MKNIFSLFCLAAFLWSCIKLEDTYYSDAIPSGDGILIINEGNFRSGNGSISFFSYDSSKVINDIFSNVNKRPLGDVPNSVMINGNNLYIVVNNSGKIEVTDKRTFRSKKIIDGLVSPRYLSVAGKNKGYITSMYSDSLTIIDMADNSISGFIDLKKTSESICCSGEEAFIANWIGGNMVMVVNTKTDEVSDSVEVGVEPESMVIDKNNILWVLCNGGWTREHFAELVGIDINTKSVVRKYVFPSKQDSPSSLCINGDGDILYYLNRGVMCMDIDSQQLPSVPLIPEMSHYFYKLQVDPVYGDIFITDAVDYQNKGFVYRFTSNGELISGYQAGIIPGFMYYISDRL